MPTSTKQKIIICDTDDEIVTANGLLESGWKVITGFSIKKHNYPNGNRVVFVLEKEEFYSLGPL